VLVGAGVVKVFGGAGVVDAKGVGDVVVVALTDSPKIIFFFLAAM